jgi:hypothetical protein
MIKVFFSLSVCLLLISSCTTGEYETVEIIGKDPTTSEVRIRGMGVRLPGRAILTSDHVVRGGMRYEVWGMNYDVVESDVGWDRAILSRIQDRELRIQDVLKSRNQIWKWDPIYTEVSRSGSIVRQVGKVVDPSGSIVGYDTTWRVVTLSGIVLTDLDLLPGDSGAPIFTLDRELVDVVHVR